MLIYSLDLELAGNSIIQIGIAGYDTKTKEFSCVVDTLCYSGELPSAYVSNLTGISEQDVRSADPFVSVARKFLTRIPREAVLIAWGSDWQTLWEATKFYKSLRLRPIMSDERFQGAIDFQDFLRVQSFLKSRGRRNHRISLSKEAKHRKIEWEGTPHTAYADALMALKIFVDEQNKQAGDESP